MYADNIERYSGSRFRQIVLLGLGSQMLAWKLTHKRLRRLKLATAIDQQRLCKK